MSEVEEQAEKEHRFRREVVDSLIAKGVHPARAEMAVEKGVRFLTMNTGTVVARVIAEYGPVEKWQDGAADILLWISSTTLLKCQNRRRHRLKAGRRRPKNLRRRRWPKSEVPSRARSDEASLASYGLIADAAAN